MAKRPAREATKKGTTKKPIESYAHKDKKRANNPPVGLVTPATDPDEGGRKAYQYDPHLDPQLVWAGKAEHTSFRVPTVSLHVHERIDPRTIIEAARKRNGHGGDGQMLLFEQPGERRSYSGPSRRWSSSPRSSSTRRQPRTSTKPTGRG